MTGELSERVPSVIYKFDNQHANDQPTELGKVTSGFVTRVHNFYETSFSDSTVHR